MSDRTLILSEILKNEDQILNLWLERQKETAGRRSEFLSEEELRRESAEFLKAFRQAVDSGAEMEHPAWEPVRELLEAMSHSRAQQGLTPSETGTFILSLKQPLFEELQRGMSGRGAEAVSAELWQTTALLDKLALQTLEFYQKSREEIINRQQRELLELSTPVIKLWEGILALPLIGTLDSERTQVVMESLLQRIVETSASIAVIDITGVPTVDTLVAQHLLKTIAAARLMGTECIVSGIRPQIAATIIQLGVDLGTVTTKSSLADAFALALNRIGWAIRREV
jgi:rsbT co-antagonist protein RsbR